METNELLTIVLGNPLNEKVLNYLNANRKSIRLEQWKQAYSPYDEGGNTLLEDYAALLPDTCKYYLDANAVLLNHATGEIFAFNKGRFSVFFKCHFEKAEVNNHVTLRRGNTLDGITSIEPLGNEWCYMDKFDDQKEQLLWAYELTGER